MRVLVTFPGKLGDLLWALPTVREISRQAGEPVDLVIGDKFSSIVELLKLQPYLNFVWAEPNWHVLETAPMSPRIPANESGMIYNIAGPGLDYDKVYHLGYEGWPVLPLPLETLQRAGQQGAFSDNKQAALRVQEPWITLPPPRSKEESRKAGVYHIEPAPQTDIYLGWTDEWFELKLGLSVILAGGQPVWTAPRQCVMPGSRWETELGQWMEILSPSTAGWLTTAKVLSSCKLYVGCLSSQWVLANALGVPAVICEPNPHRHNPIFWWDGPVEKDGKPRNRMVLGNDGLPTFDARAVVQAVKEELERAR